MLAVFKGAVYKTNLKLIKNVQGAEIKKATNLFLYKNSDAIVLLNINILITYVHQINSNAPIQKSIVMICERIYLFEISHI